MKERVFPPRLFFHVDFCIILVDGQIQFSLGCGKPRVLSRAPLHGRAGAGSVIAAVFGQIRVIRHADFIAVIDERNTREREEESKDHLHVLFVPPEGNARKIVIPGRNAHISFISRRRYVFGKIREKFGRVSPAVAAEIAVAVREIDVRSRFFAEQFVITVRKFVCEKVHVESPVPDRLKGLTPFGDENSIRIFLSDCAEQLFPDFRAVIVGRIVLDDGGRQIHAETGDAHAQVKAHDVEHFLVKRLQPLVVPLHLPGIFFSGKAEVERGLRVKKVGHVAPVALAVSAYQRIGRDGKDVVRPNIIVAVSVLLLLLAFLKPFVLARRVPCHEIQEDLHAERFCARKKAPEIVHRAEPFVDGVIVGYVVSAVPEGRTIDGIDPHEICKLPDVFQLFRDAVQVADPVSVGIVEGGGINGVDDRTFNGWIFHRPVLLAVAHQPDVRTVGLRHVHASELHDDFLFAPHAQRILAEPSQLHAADLLLFIHAETLDALCRDHGLHVFYGSSVLEVKIKPAPDFRVVAV